jgi:hypothetical protein
LLDGLLKRPPFCFQISQLPLLDLLQLFTDFLLVTLISKNLLLSLDSLVGFL